MSDREIKVTDKRMFTPQGELREGFKHLEGVEAASDDVPAAAPPEASPVAPPPAPEPSPRETRQSPPLELPTSPGALGAPSFFDLVSLLAEPVLIYLGEAKLPDGESAENLELARLHIDMLDLLRQKTSGRLTVEEAGFLEDLLYQLRLRYVQRRG
jgi:Domain of unknown function (DUF1844)